MSEQTDATANEVVVTAVTDATSDIVANANAATEFNAFAIQHFYLLPIEAKADAATAELVFPRILAFLFGLAMAAASIYTIYFVIRQMILFCVSYSSNEDDWTLKKEDRAKYLAELGDLKGVKDLSNGHLRLLNFAMTWCSDDKANDVYQVYARIVLTR